MKPLKTQERAHIKELGEKWPVALAAAMLSVKLNPKLVGLDKVREPMAVYAALKATGCEGHEGFVVPKNAGDSIVGFQEICDAAFNAAVRAVLKRLIPA